jgi:hypothetical protein
LCGVHNMDANVKRLIEVLFELLVRGGLLRKPR